MLLKSVYSSASQYSKLHSSYLCQVAESPIIWLPWLWIRCPSGFKMKLTEMICVYRAKEKNLMLIVSSWPTCTKRFWSSSPFKKQTCTIAGFKLGLRRLLDSLHLKYCPKTCYAMIFFHQNRKGCSEWLNIAFRVGGGEGSKTFVHWSPHAGSLLALIGNSAVQLSTWQLKIYSNKTISWDNKTHSLIVKKSFQ